MKIRYKFVHSYTFPRRVWFALISQLSTVFVLFLSSSASSSSCCGAQLNSTFIALLRAVGGEFMLCHWSISSTSLVKIHLNCIFLVFFSLSLSPATAWEEIKIVDEQCELCGAGWRKAGNLIRIYPFQVKMQSFSRVLFMSVAYMWKFQVAARLLSISEMYENFCLFTLSCAEREKEKKSENENSTRDFVCHFSHKNELRSSCSNEHDNYIWNRENLFEKLPLVSILIFTCADSAAPLNACFESLSPPLVASLPARVAREK